MAIGRLFQLAVIALALFGLALVVRLASGAGIAVSAIWPGSALIVAAYLRWARTPAERTGVIVGCTAGVALGNIATGAPLLMGLLYPIGNLIEVGAAIWMFRRFGPPLDDLKSFFAFLLVPVLAAPALSACFAAGATALLQPERGPWLVLRHWFVATMIGMAVLGPFVLSVRGPRPISNPHRRRLQFLGAQALLLVASLVIFLHPDRPPLFAIYPFLALAALSHIELGGPVGLLIAAAVSLVGTLLGRGPAKVAVLVDMQPIDLMQISLAAMAFSILPITALLRRLERYAAELEQRRLEAEALTAIKTRLLAYVSHEIRSPLSGVTGLAQMMHDGAIGEITPAQREVLGKIAMTGAEVDALARDLIDAAALQSGRTRVEIACVEAAEAGRQAVEAVGFRAAEYAAEIAFEPPQTPVEVAADPLRLRQILVNLLVNAAKYGGRPPRVRLSVEAAGADHVRFVVADNGLGLAPELRAALFKDFERLGAEKSDIAGSGLGLALSREIAELQNGRLGVDSGTEGSRFWLELPIWRDEAAAA